MKNGLEIDEYGNKFWYKNGKWHREDGPAVELNNGTYFEYWIKHERINFLIILG